MKNIRFRRIVLLAPIVAVLAISACSTTQGFGKRFSSSEQTSAAYSDYLLARYASSEADVKAAAKYYARALKNDPKNIDLQQRVMLSALFASKVKQAAKQARVILKTNPNDRLAVLVVASDAISKGQYQAAISSLKNTQLGPLNQVAGRLLYAWAFQGNGDSEAALLTLKDAQLSPVLGDFALFHKALIFAQLGNKPKADQAFTEAMSSGLLNSRTAYGWAVAQINWGQKQQAQKLLSSRLAANKYEVEAGYLQARLQSEALHFSAFSTVKEGAAEALFGPAQAMAERSLPELAIIYLELALHINPKHDAARVLLGRLYNLQKRTDDALNMLAKIKSNQPWYLQAQLESSSVLFQAERREEGIKRLAKLNKKTPNKRVQRALASALQIDKQFDEALVLYNQLINSDPEAADWQLYFSRAVCLERTGRWREAVPDFRKSLTLRPNQADVLNYLGYTFIDNEENLDEGFALIRKAIELAPTAGYIVDSLGWGYYRLGEFDKAVTELERAVELEPAEPTINDHLGDAYWQVGRKLEAKYQWQRVLSLQPDEEVDLELVQSKIQNGLPSQIVVQVDLEN